MMIGKYVSWCALKKKDRDVTPMPYDPTDDEFITAEKLAMKMWKITLDIV